VLQSECSTAGPQTPDRPSGGGAQNPRENEGVADCLSQSRANSAPTDPDSLLIIDAWPALPADVRRMHVGMVNLSKK